MVKENTVIEFKYSENKWIPLRVRDDKTEMYLKGKAFGNDWNVAVSNFNSIKYNSIIIEHFHCSLLC